MMATMERDPVCVPTIVRRAYEGGLETMSRIYDGREALCVFWSIEHAERDMNANGFSPEEGWKAIERDRDELALVLDLMAKFGKAELVFLEPSPEDATLQGIFEPGDFLAVLDASGDDNE